MAIADNFAISTPGKVISYGGAAHGATGAGYYTVLEFHRWLQGLADNDASTGDDYLDISRETPSDKLYDTIITLVNGYTIDAAASEHLYGGSIIIGTTATDIWDGIQILAAPGCHAEIIQGGAIIANDFWNNVPFGTGLKGLNPDVTNGISHRFMVKVRAASADLDGRRMIVTTREFGYTYSEFKVNGTGRGVNVVPLTYVLDLNNETDEVDVAAYADISNQSVGYNGIDVNANGADEYYYSEWARGTKSINQFYEYMKWLTRRGYATTIYGLQGQVFRGITHEITVDTKTGPSFAAYEAVSWTGGTGQLLAINSVSAPTKLWIQLLTGVAPTDNQAILGASTGQALVNVTVTERAISQPFCGVSTGSSIIGAFGFGIKATDLGVSDKVFDLTNTLVRPPNVVTWTVAGLVSGEDYILVGPDTGSTVLDVGQFTLNGLLNGAAVTSVVVTGAIPADTPTSGSIRILRTSGVYSRHAYSSWTGSTFTLTAATDFSSNTAPNGTNCYVSYIDKLATGATESFQAIYVSARNLFVRRRYGGAVGPTKTFETTGTLGSASSTLTVQRLSDA